MPQYYVGHKLRIAKVEEGLARWPGLYFAGNAYDGVGIPHCIHSGEQAAERAVKLLAQRAAA
jgi:oxygen-dependent protoporphyrinogen oxidase